jgi:class 3 adenylate cyclase/predicted ATPase
MDVASWLRSLGLEKYEPVFRENEIDADVLPELTELDLEKLGVPLGHRKRLLKAIAALRDDASVQPPAVTLAPAPPPAATPTGQQIVEPRGERRHVTVMFCDLVGSTSISAGLDAEDWRDLVGSYLDAASAAVTEMGGHVAKKLGDGLMALFGYPVGQENDAERAARAALSIQRSLSEINRKNATTGKPALNARIGIEIGPVVVDAAGEIYGDAPNTAARVQALADPGTVVVTAQVQRQIAGLFVAEERGSHQLKGVPEPVTLFQLVRASGGGRRPGQRHLTPLVGREEEIAILTRRWERAQQSDGQLVLIVGEPGIGKSRLIEEFHARLRDTPHTWVEWSCSQLLQNTSLHPIAEWGRQRFGSADIAAERRLSDLENTLALIKLDPAENAPLLAPLLDIPVPPERRPSFAPEELRRRQLAALTNWVMAGARAQPVVLTFEDLHWADPTTLDVLRGIAERGALAPLFVLLTARPEFRPSWGARSNHGAISLVPLDRYQVRHMVEELAARHALAKEVIEGVSERTGGVPLFVEEVTRLLLERGEQGGIQAIPPTLQQSLTARLDRLGPAREVAQIGAVIGRGFSYPLIRAVAEIEDTALQSALERLAEADILLVQGLPPDSEYRFKHALIQDAAYENLLRSRRQVLHRRVAEILRDRFTAAADAEPEVLAHHFTQAGLTDAAIEWWGKAGNQALRRSAFQEAITHLGKAIEMADKAALRAATAPATTPARERLKLQTSYGRAMAWSKGFAAEEAKAAFARAAELAPAVDDADARFVAYYGLWLGSFARGELAMARKAAETFQYEAENETRITDAAVARCFLGYTCLLEGDFTKAQILLEQALQAYVPERDREAQYRFTVDTRVRAAQYLAHASWLLGGVGRARELIEEAAARADESDYVPNKANVYFFNATLETLRDDAAAAFHASAALVELSREHGFGFFLTLGLLSSSWACARLGDSGTDMMEFCRALAAYTDRGNKVYVPFYRGLLAEIEAETGGEEGALARIDSALALAQETGEHWSDAFLHRTRGEILLKRDGANTAPAAQAFLTAIVVAQQQKARSFELRAATSLARLRRDQGKVSEARELLAPVYGWFTEGFDTRDLKEAKTLLEELGSY